MAFWRTEHYARKYRDDIFGIVASQLLVVAAMSMAWCLSAGDIPVSMQTLSDMIFPASGSLSVPISVVWTGIMTTALPVFAETFAMKEVSFFFFRESGKAHRILSTVLLDLSCNSIVGFFYAMKGHKRRCKRSPLRGGEYDVLYCANVFSCLRHR